MSGWVGTLRHFRSSGLISSLLSWVVDSGQISTLSIPAGLCGPGHRNRVIVDIAALLIVTATTSRRRHLLVLSNDDSALGSRSLGE